MPQYLQVLNIVPIQRPSSHDVTAALLMPQNRETAAMLVFLRDGSLEKLWRGERGIFEPQEFFFVIKFLAIFLGHTMNIS